MALAEKLLQYKLYYHTPYPVKPFHALWHTITHQVFVIVLSTTVFCLETLPQFKKPMGRPPPPPTAAAALQAHSSISALQSSWGGKVFVRMCMSSAHLFLLMCVYIAHVVVCALHAFVYWAVLTACHVMHTCVVYIYIYTVFAPLRVS